MVKLIIHIHALLFKLCNIQTYKEYVYSGNISICKLYSTDFLKSILIKCLSLKSTTVVINEKKHCGTEMRACQNCKDVQNDI